MSEQNSNDVAAPSVAVIGMAGRLPGADSINDFWQMIVKGREGITFFPPDALDPSIDPALRANPNYVPAKGVVKDADCFDAQFFGISPMEARVMDPQQRLSLEVCWHALEDAAVTSESFDGLIGVYAGSNWNRYRTTNLAGTETEARYGAFNTSLANEQEFLATRIAYKLDLRGPAITVSSACSTSLVAIAEACKALFAFDCDLALAGGASISTPLNAGYLYQEGSMLSSDGHCRSFDAQASGTTFNDGVAYVVLKRTEDAIADGDQIYAVVRGFGVNNDGANKVSFTAPSVDGQTAAVTSAIEYADVDPATIGLIETHGTATPMGDPIEIEALKRAFAGVDKVGHCAIGSVKTNIGHVVHAAGAAGFIKAVMSVRDGVLPPSLFFEQENPKLGLADSPFFVNAELRDWPATLSPRRAGVSSFGVGGTNAHVIIEQAPVPDEQPASDGAELMFLSARSPEALKRYAKSFANLPAGTTSKSRSAIARVLRTGRAAMPHRMAWVADSTETLDPGMLSRGEVQRGQADEPRQIVFLCTGQGSQRIAMGRKLAEFDSVFGAYWTRGLSQLKARGIDLQRVLDEAEDVDVPTIQRTEFAQPALYLFEYAMGRSLIEAGVQPDLLIGHSIGEFAAAALAEVFSFEQGLDIVVKRGALMQAQPTGDMIAAFVDAKEAARYTSETVAIAAENAPGATVLSGPETDMQELAKTLANDGVEFRPVKTSHAFHSSMMAPAATAFRDYLSEFEFSPPKTPIVSTVTATYLTEEEAIRADYWSDQLLKPVRFAAAVSFAQQKSPVAAVEVGPGKVLASLAKMSAADNRLVSHATAPDAGATDSDRHAARRAAGFVWVNGGSVAARKDRGAATSAVSLPGYPFERTRHWVDERAQSMVVAAANTAPSNENLSAPMISAAAEQPANAVDQTMNAQNHRQQLIDRLIRVLEDVSG
ncbi:MAG: type I polyketide synthase, partial [Pseudomonadota bacterium]